jgi:DNA-binding NarL/FixJ family response regulator
VIVEDHGLIAQTVASAFRARGSEVEIVVPTDRATVIDDVVGFGPDLAMLDLDLGGSLTAVDLLPHLTVAKIPSIVVTGVHDPVARAECVAAGALGVLTKDGSFEDLVHAVERALSGQPLLDGDERNAALALLRRHREEQEQRLRPFRDLSPREQQVLARLCAGQSVEQIARTESVAVSTVRSQVRSILRKVGVSSQLAAIARANDVGWQPADPVRA